MVATIPNPNPRDGALRALRDCAVIRVRLGNVMPGYQQLQREGLLSARRFADTALVNISLNDKGKAQAALLPPTPGGKKL